MINTRAPDGANKNTQIPLINGDLLLVFVADNEPDDSSKTSDQVEQGQDQPHHVNLGQDVNSKMFSKMFFLYSRYLKYYLKTLTSLSSVQHPWRIATYMARPARQLGHSSQLLNIIKGNAQLFRMTSLQTHRLYISQKKSLKSEFSTNPRCIVSFIPGPSTVQTTVILFHF